MTLQKQSEATQSRTDTQDSSSTKKHGAKFIAVRDSRKRAVPGLYQRNGRFYAQLWVSRDDGQKTARKFPLLTPDGEAVANLIEAKEAADILRNDRREKNSRPAATSPSSPTTSKPISSNP